MLKYSKYNTNYNWNEIKVESNLRGYKLFPGLLVQSKKKFFCVFKQAARHSIFIELSIFFLNSFDTSIITEKMPFVWCLLSMIDRNVKNGSLVSLKSFVDQKSLVMVRILTSIRFVKHLCEGSCQGVDS